MNGVTFYDLDVVPYRLSGRNLEIQNDQFAVVDIENIPAITSTGMVVLGGLLAAAGGSVAYRVGKKEKFSNK